MLNKNIYIKIGGEMSKITVYNKKTKLNIGRAPTDVVCDYYKQDCIDGREYLVITTYNPSSQNGKVSQTLHFTKDNAVEIINIFRKEFNI